MYLMLFNVNIEQIYNTQIIVRVDKSIVQKCRNM